VVCGEGGLGEGLGRLGIDPKLLGDGGLSFGEWRKGIEKNKILCVILMENGWRTQVSYVALSFIKCGKYSCLGDKVRCFLELIYLHFF
jgi:hypothetical protein